MPEQVTSLPSYNRLPAEELYQLKRLGFVITVHSMADNYPDFLRAQVVRALFLQFDPEVKGSTQAEKEQSLYDLLTGQHLELIAEVRDRYEPVANQAVDYAMTALYEDEAYKPFVELLKDEVIQACVKRTKQSLLH